MPELQIAPEKVGWLILKARAYDAKVAPAIEPGDEEEDDEEQFVENSADDPDVAEIIGFIRALNEDEESDLVALAWVGRGTFDAADWEEARRTARAREAATAGEGFAASERHRILSR